MNFTRRKYPTAVSHPHRPVAATFIPTQMRKLKLAATAHPESDPIRLNPTESDP